MLFFMLISTVVNSFIRCTQCYKCQKVKIHKFKLKKTIKSQAYSFAYSFKGSQIIFTGYFYLYFILLMTNCVHITIVNIVSSNKIYSA